MVSSMLWNEMKHVISIYFLESVILMKRDFEGIPYRLDEIQ